MSTQILYQNPTTGKAYDITNRVSSASWKTQRVGSPAQLDITVIDDPAVTFEHGGIVTLSAEGTGLFYGYVFKISQNEKQETQVTAYDQMRYLKNKDTYVFAGQRADEIVAQIAADFGIKVGNLENTGYAIPKMIEDGQTLFDIILKALDYTLINSRAMYYLWDDFGALTLSDVSKSALPLMIGDGSLATGYTYTSDIDSDTANRIKLVRDNKTTGKREVYIVEDSANGQKWGVLQHYDKVAEELNEAQIEAMADSLLELKNRPSQTFQINALANLAVRAGRSIFVDIEERGIKGWYIIDECTHDLLKETMTIKLVIY